MKLARQFMLVVFVILISVQPVFAATTDGMIESLNSNEVETYFCENQFNSIMEARNYSCFEIYKAKPEIFLSGSTWEHTRYGTNKNNQIVYIRYDEAFVGQWNNSLFTEQFWKYVESVIAASGVTENDSIRDKVTKLAIFIGNNYRYDYEKCESNLYDNGISYFKSLTEQQISFCLMDSCLFMACCNKLSIPCKYVDGEANGYHAWNRVNIDGEWLDVDVSYARKAKNKSNYILFHSDRLVYTEIG